MLFSGGGGGGGGGGEVLENKSVFLLHRTAKG